ncbi:Ionotropic receptor 40a-like 3, partial [Homarus americanus]
MRISPSVVVMVTVFVGQLVMAVAQVISVGEDNQMKGVGVVVREVVELYLSACYLVVVDASNGSSTYSDILRSLAGVYKGILVMDTGTHTFSSSSSPPAVDSFSPLLEFLKEGDAKLSCRALIFDLTSATSPHQALEREARGGGTHTLSLLPPGELQDPRAGPLEPPHWLSRPRPSLPWYEIRVPWDNQWGMRQEGGNWTGTVGTLQHHQADFSMLLNWSQERRLVIDFSRIYAAEPLVMVTSKPRPLPRYLSIVSPFTGEVWCGVLVMVVCGGVVYWGLQKARSHLGREEHEPRVLPLLHHRAAATGLALQASHRYY